MEQSRKILIRDMRKGLPVALSLSIADALNLIASGRIEHARDALENALRYADAIDRQVSDNVGLASVRSGKAFG